MRILATVTVLLFAVPAMASVQIPGLYNTGVDDLGALLPDGTLDSHYTIVASSLSTSVYTPGAPFTYGAASVQLVRNAYPGSWVLNTASSQWIGPSQDSVLPFDPDWAGTFDYVLTFDLTGLLPSTATIAGSWATDNGSQMYLNGNLVATKGADGYKALTNFSITSGFISGVNELRFVVTNALENLDPNPSGLQVNGLTGMADAVPEPLSLLVWSGLTMAVSIVAARRHD